MLGQQAVDLRAVLLNPADQHGGVLRDRGLGPGGPLAEQAQHVLAADLGFVQEVKRPLAGLTAGGHGGRGSEDEGG